MFSASSENMEGDGKPRAFSLNSCALPLRSPWRAPPAATHHEQPCEHQVRSKPQRLHGGQGPPVGGSVSAPQMASRSPLHGLRLVEERFDLGPEVIGRARDDGRRGSPSTGAECIRSHTQCPAVSTTRGADDRPATPHALLLALQYRHLDCCQVAVAEIWLARQLYQAVVQP